MAEPPENEHEPIWHRRWFQKLLVVLVAAAVVVLVVPPVLALLYAVRPVLLPVLIGLVLAYVAHPLASWLKHRWRVPRTVTAAGLMLALVAAAINLAAYLGPKLVRQLADLLAELPRYLNRLAANLDLELAQLITATEQWVRDVLAGEGELDLAAVSAAVWRSLDIGVGVIGTTIGMAAYLTIAGMVVAFCFFFFLWKFDRLTGWFVPFIPASRRPRILDLVKMMDRSVSAFIRGRLIQAMVVAVVLSVGWWWADVPYWLLLGVGSGVLNLIPYAAIVGWPLAVGLTWLDTITGTPATAAAASGFDFWAVLFWPSFVYLIAQGLDGWVIEPVVQGQATGLDPLTVLLMVLLGGALMGLLGLLIAIPAAACIKILAREELLPRWRAWAEAT